MTQAARKSAHWGLGLLLPIAGFVFASSCSSEKAPIDRRSSAKVTPLERAALADTPSLPQDDFQNAMVVTFGDSYEPFAWGEGPAVKGVQVDFINEILVKRMGLNVRFEGCPWKRCQKWVREGQKDAFFTVPTPERNEYTVTPSVPFYETNFVMHVKKGSPILEELRQVRSVEDLERLPHLRHVHMLGSGWHENALRNMKNVMTVPNASVIPQMLVLGRADVYIEQEEMFKYQANSAGLSNEVTTLKEPAIMHNEWHLFIGKNSKYRSIVPELNRVLTALKERGGLEQIKQRIFEKYGI